MRPVIRRRPPAEEPECLPLTQPMRVARPARRPDPAPSRLSYRLHRLWLRPLVRRLALRGAPVLALLAGGALWLGDGDEIARLRQGWDGLRAQIEARPEFTVATARVEGADPALAAAIEGALPALPASSFRLDLEAIRADIAAMPPVAATEVRIVAGGVLGIRVEERQAAAVWRGPEGLQALDAEGRALGPLGARAERADLLLLAGRGAQAVVPEALALQAAAGALAPHLAGLVRVGERRWDAVLGNGVRILLPAEGAVAAFERAAVLQAQDLAGRDVERLDLRVPGRAVVRPGPRAQLTLARVKAEERRGRPAEEEALGDAGGRRRMTDLHGMQRAMRAMRRAALGHGVCAVLDVGSSKVAGFVLRFREPGLGREPAAVGPLAGQGRVQVIGAAATRSRGVRFGEIATMRETERAIRTVVDGAQRAAGVRVDHVMACLAGADPRSYALTGMVPVQGEVRETDVARAMAACDPPDLGPHRHVLHAQPVNFTLDHRTGLADPRGQIGQRLACDMHLLSVEASAAANLAQCVKRCDLELAGLASSSYASGLAALVEDEQELGAACVDMGGGATAVSIFMRRHMIFGGAVRMGGDHVTTDVHKGLQVSLGTAERIKTLHGGVHATGLDDREMIEVGGDTGDWEHDRRSVSRAELIGVMRPRVEEILEEARALLDAAGFDAMPSRKVVLTGGGSQVPGLDQLATRILGHQVRLGRPLRLRGVPQELTGPGFAALTGLCLSAAHPQDEWWDFALPAEAGSRLGLGRAVRWLRQNW